MDVSKLNPEQRAAVTYGPGPLLVLAGAGSGKTRVITFRIAHLLRRGVPPRAIAALTFTNKAAEEMRERVGALIGDRKAAADLTMGTFHSLGLRILKAERKALGFPRGFVIYDTADQIGCVREVLRRLPGRRNDAGRRFDVKAILTRISLAKNAFVAPEAYEPGECDDYDEITAEVYPRYQEALRAYAAVDFDDLIAEPVRLFESGHAAAWKERFRYVLVDEYQDTNRAQLRLVRHLVEGHDNLTVVGDDDQSIYAWRGADATNILRFDRMFPGATVVKLEQNYRSTRTILSAANAVIAHNVARHGKDLWSQHGDGEVITHAVAPTADEEAKFVAREIDRLRGEDGIPFRDMAVLYRSNIQTRVLEEELRERRIPYAMFGGQQFFERKEVKDLIAYLRAALNSRDEISLRRIVNYPSRGIGATTLARLAEASHAHRVPLSEAAARAATWLPELRPKALRAIDGFVEVMDALRADLERGSAVAATRALIERIDLEGDIRAASPSATAAQRRLDNIAALLRSLERFEAKGRGGNPALAEYLRRLALDTGDDDADTDKGNRVVLTTLHGAKGLEFPVVFIIGMEEELLPHARTLQPQATDVGDPDHCSDVSEERRLCYVGITRAKRKLYLTRSVFRTARGKNVSRTPSRFLLEIPEELLEVRDIAEEAREPVATDEVRDFFKNFAID